MTFVSFPFKFKIGGCHQIGKKRVDMSKRKKELKDKQRRLDEWRKWWS